MISPQFHPLVGGYERAALRLSGALTEKGHDVTVVTERRQKNWPKNETINTIKIKRLWCLHRPHIHQITSLLSLGTFLLLKGRHYQIWHIHQYGLQALLVIGLGKLLNRPVILKLTSSASMGIGQSISRLPLPGLCRVLLKQVKQVIAMTRETRAEAIRFGIQEQNISCIGNGIDTVRFRPVNKEVRASIRKNHDIRVSGIVMAVGRLSQEKNHFGLIEAWQKAHLDLPDGWLLIIVGDGPLKKTLKEYIATNDLDNSVFLAGHRDNVEEWLAMADIYVLASHNEGLSNTMLEAMACGLPAIATEVSGATENIGENDAGIVIPCGDTLALASAIQQLATQEELRHQKGRRGREVIMKKFSLGKVTDQFLQLYQRLINKEAVKSP